MTAVKQKKEREKERTKGKEGRKEEKSMLSETNMDTSIYARKKDQENLKRSSPACVRLVATHEETVRANKARGS